ncbi:MAG: ThuA domain-containing protein [Chthoniobacter sp.]|nr:ThuA domain-containing protein [Chthoniobacter sp.]
MNRTSFLALLASSTLALHSFAADAPKPLRILLITGGCCHDYAKQKDVLKAGLEARANVIVEHAHSADGSTKPPIEQVYGKPGEKPNPDYAKGYDLVIHDECSAGVNDPEVIKAVLQPHVDGIPGVNLHCGMHSYRFGDYRKPVPVSADNGKWYEYIGLQSTGHGAQQPIAITYTEKESPITKGLTDWETINEELYNNVQILTAKALARGKQGNADNVVTWTNEYGPKKTRVFSTTIGHNTATVADARYLDLVTRGVLWATGHLKDDGTPAEGYGPVAK